RVPRRPLGARGTRNGERETHPDRLGGACYAWPMSTGIVLDQRYLEHDPGYGHPERPERIGVFLPDALDRPGITRVEPRMATADDVTLVHGEGHFERVAHTRDVSRYAFDADTPVSARSFDTACLAVGGVLALLDEVVAGRVHNGFALVRP